MDVVVHVAPFSSFRFRSRLYQGVVRHKARRVDHEMARNDPNGLGNSH